MSDFNLVSPIVTRWRDEAREDPTTFWGKAASHLHWFHPWDRVFDWNFPEFRWFTGGETNLAYNALDHHVNRGWGGHTALVYLNERGQRDLYTYAQLLREVERTAAALRGLGLQKGDRLTIYMPTCPEAIILMLATVRIGAIHSIVFAGFGAGALGDRIRASGSRAVFAADITYRKGKDVYLKEIVDHALEGGEHSVEHVVVLKRGAAEVPMTPRRDLTWEEFRAKGTSQHGHAVPMESNDPAFILATSGTTAKPKLAVHTHGAYQVWIHSMARWVFGLTPQDVWWSTSDIGWIVGHSYIVYAPLLIGCTTLVYEGAIDHPDPGTLWRLVEDFQVTGIFTSPTAVRLLMRYGESFQAQYDHKSLTRVFCAGEVLNAPAWEWLQHKVFKDRIPVIDHMWQTETGGPIFGNPYGLGMLPTKPGSAGIPLAGIDCEIVTADGHPCPPGAKGIMAIKRPFPGLIQSLWGEPERYVADYWGRIPGMNAYYTGDSAMIDADGYVWFAGRADEVIKIAAHRLGTIEVETALLRHPAVVEAGVTGRPDDLRGEVISAFVVLRAGHTASDALKHELIETVRNELGPVAVVGEIHFVHMLPKTRSGKIMRRVFKAVILGRDPGDISTIEDEVSVDEARRAWASLISEINDEGMLT
ncbi:MAG TPA: acetate--CoA ligase [Anaerolineales bacterium]|nr:acetate--CoA ligase [Anaerolineales bacterium]